MSQLPSPSSETKPHFRRVVITGATGGLGQALVRQMSRHTQNMILMGRNEKILFELKTMLQRDLHFSGEVDLLTLDLENIWDLEAKQKFDQVAEFAKPIDLVINNAGIGFAGPFSEMSEMAIHQTMALNIQALTNLCRFFVEKMKDERRGQILNISSFAAFLPIPTYAVYAASKSYVLSLSLALDAETQDFGVRVKTLCPAGIDTGFGIKAGLDKSALKQQKKSFTSADVVAQEAIQLLRSKHSHRIVGWKNRLMAMILRLLPLSICAALAKKEQAKFFPKKNT